MVKREPRYETYARCCTREQRPHSKPAIITNEQCVALGTVGLIRSLQNSIFVAILGALNPYHGKSLTWPRGNHTYACGTPIAKPGDVRLISGCEGRHLRTDCFCL